MALYEQEVLDKILGLAVITDDWKVGVYYNGTNPLTDIATAEIPGLRIDLPGLTWVSTGGGYYASTEIMTWGPFTACSIGGWFVANGAAETDILWSKAFTAPVSVSTGDYLTLASGLFTLGIA